MPIRKITNGGKKVIGLFPSIKMGRMIGWESQLERDCLFLIEMDPDVYWYEEQPKKITYYVEGKAHTYTPDLLVLRRSRDIAQLVAVKSKEKAESEEWQSFFDIVRPICQDKYGYEYLVVTDREIRIQPRLNNIKLIYKYARTGITTAHQICLHKMFAGKKTLSLQEIVLGFAGKDSGIAEVYTLIYKGVLTVDLSQPLSLVSTASITLPPNSPEGPGRQELERK
jgi:TnsA endonuclease N terminal